MTDRRNAGHLLRPQDPDRLWAAVSARPPSRRVGLNDLLDIYTSTFPDRLGDGSTRRHLAEIISAWVESGRVVASVSVDGSASPPLPRFCTRTDIVPVRRAPTEFFAVMWAPELRWVPALRPTPPPTARAALVAVNEWLAAGGRSAPLVGAAERSLQIFADEKAFGRVGGDVVWGPGRVDADLLRCVVSHVPLVTTPTGHPSGREVLVVENLATYHSAAAVLARLNDSRFGAVGWGDGVRFRSSVLAVNDVTGLNTVRYFGDVDDKGVEIATGAAHTGKAANIDVACATELYRLLIEQGRTRPGQAVHTDVSWFAPDVRGAIRTLLADGLWLPQEGVDRALFASTVTTWASA